MATQAVRKARPVARKSGTNGRTTPAKPKTSKVPTYVDPDGNAFRLSGKINTFLLLKIEADAEDNSFNAVDIYRLITGMVVEADRSAFITAMSRKADMDAENLNLMMVGMLEEAAGRNPTNSRSGSGRTAKPNASRALSAAS